MKTSIYLLTILCCFVFSSSIAAQKKKPLNRTTKTTSNNVRLIKSKPHIFISYEREGKIEPLYEGESNKRIWLRFNNNSRWTVKFCLGLVPKEYGETEIEYEIERYEGYGEIPGTSSSDNCQYLLIASGKSILFSIPKEHLANGLAIKIQFRYEWEDDEDGSDNMLEPKHYVYFYSSDIPKK